MGDNQKISISMPKKHPKRKKRLIIIAIVVIVLVGLGVSYKMFFEAFISNLFATPEQRISQIIKDATSDNDLKTAHEELKKLADNESNVEKKLVYLYGSADLYYNSNDYKGGLAMSQSIDAINGTALSAASIASEYMGLGDYENAAKYYGIAASRSEKPARTTESCPYNDYIISQKAAEALIE